MNIIRNFYKVTLALLVVLLIFSVFNFETNSAYADEVSTGLIQGQKFDWETGGGIADWKVNLYLEGEFLSSTTTTFDNPETDKSEHGMYRFTGLSDGIYQVCEEREENSIQFLSNADYEGVVVCENEGTIGYEITIEEGGIVKEINFAKIPEEEENGRQTSDTGSDSEDDGGSVPETNMPSGDTEVLGANVAFSCQFLPFINDHLHASFENDVFEVKKLQMFLNAFMESNLETSGTFDRETLEAVKDFQIAYHNQILEPWFLAGHLPTEFTPTGYVYVTTKRMINVLVCPPFNPPIPTPSSLQPDPAI